MGKKKAQESDFDNMGDFTLHMVLWLILPGLFSGWLQKGYYYFRCKGKGPQPGSARHRRDHDRCYMIVIGVYLFYCIFSSIYMLPNNYYDDFGVTPTSGEKEIKAKFRKYSLMYHPDRKPGPEAEGEFMRLRKIYESLTSPVLREVYNKFGPSQSCNGCILFKDFLWNALMHFIGFYGGIALVLVILNMVGSGQYGTYWRFMAFFGMMVLEANMIFLPYDPIAWFLPNCTVAEKISILHQCITYVFMAINQIGPLIFPQQTADVRDAMRRLEKQALIQEKETSKYFEKQLKPFIEDPSNYSLLKSEMQKRSMHVRLLANDEDYRRTTDTYLSKNRAK